MEKLNAVVVGVGSMGRNHARNFFEMKGVDLVGVCDKDKKTTSKTAERFRCEGYTDYRKLIPENDVDVASIVVPTQSHLKVALDLMEAGVHVLVEKPIAATVSEGEEMIKAAEKNNVKLSVGHIERFNPAVVELKRRLDKGELGRIFEIRAHRVGPFPARIRDVGVVIDLASHDLDLMRYLMDSEAKRVYAETGQRIHTKHEDLISGLLKFNNDAIGVLNVNWLTPEKIREINVTGEKGMFVAKHITQELFFHENVSANSKDYAYSDILMGVSEGDTMSIRIKKKEPLRLELEAFVECVRKNTPPPVSGRDGIEALRLATLLIESAQKNKVITL